MHCNHSVKESQHHPKNFLYMLPCKVVTAQEKQISLPQMMKMKLRKVKALAQDHIFGHGAEMQSQACLVECHSFGTAIANPPQQASYGQVSPYSSVYPSCGPSFYPEPDPGFLQSKVSQISSPQLCIIQYLLSGQKSEWMGKIHFKTRLYPRRTQPWYLKSMDVRGLSTEPG